ncbi:MAG: carbon-nitrogen hydrolase [Gammaproteobacteria bacterium]|nr:carbon-nitrogen hydrolase [Gammaproteobacteria bacterium]
MVQHAWGIHTENTIRHLNQNICNAASEGAQLILLQEMHDSRYFCQVEELACFDTAEPIPGPTTERLGQLAADLQVVIVGSVFEKRSPGLYHNTAVVMDADGSLAGSYRKMHIPDDPGYYEKFYFAPGDKGFRPIDTAVGRLGVMVCWDQWFPEAARCMALAGAELLLYPTAIGWNPEDDDLERFRQLDAWLTIQRAHAIANGVPLLVCNRVGAEPDPSRHTDGILFWGHSFVCGPQGEMLARAGETESLLLADIDMNRCETVRNAWPFFRDRRIDAYDGLKMRFDDKPSR